jgi:dynein heavy chain
MDHKGWYDRT